MDEHSPVSLRAYRPRTKLGVVRHIMRGPARGPLVGSGALALVGSGLWLASTLGLGLGALGPWLPWLVLAMLGVFIFALMPPLMLLGARLSAARALWRRSVLVDARVEAARPVALADGRQGVALDYTYFDAEGRVHRASTRVPAALLGRASSAEDPEALPGSSLVVACDRLDPAINVVPAFEVELFEVVRREDRRPLLGPGGQAPEVALGQGRSVSVFADAPGQGRWGRGRALDWRLHLDQDGLSWLGPDGAALRVSWAHPFAVVTSAWIVSETLVDLHVQVRQRGWSPQTPSLSFTVRVRQDEVDRGIHIKEERFGHVTRADFEAIWAALRHHAQLHGQEVEARVEVEAAAVR